MAEVLVVGTGPLILMRALALARSGRSITVIDRGTQPGGSWITPSILGFSNVEVGVHLLENRAGLYTALTGDLGIDLDPDDGRSFGLFRGRRIDLATTRVLFHSLIAIKALRDGHLDRFRRIGLSARRALFAIRDPFAYPRAGCSAITSALTGRLELAGTRFLFDAELHGLDLAVSGGKIRCVTSLGPASFDRVLIGSRAHAPLRVDGVLQIPAVERSVCHNIVLHVVARTGAQHGYVEVLGDPQIKRLRDVTAFARPAPPPGERLICVQVRGRPTADDRTAGMSVLGHLRRLGLVTADTGFLAACRQDVHLETLTEASLRRLSASSAGRIEAMPTTDLAEGYVSLASRTGNRAASLA